MECAFIVNNQILGYPMKSISILNLLLVIMSTSVFGQGSESLSPADSIMPVVQCADFAVTGNGSSAEWNKARWITFEQRDPGPAYATRFKIMYSPKGIYCLYYCMDYKITATLKGDNLDIYREDVVEAFFWARESMPVYFEYELSPLNYELVLMVPNYDGDFLGWIPWHYQGERLTRHAVSIGYDPDHPDQVTSWTGEFFIPFELMKPMVQFPPKPGTLWRANFYRIDYDHTPPSHWSWLPVENTFHDYRRFGTIVFE